MSPKTPPSNSIQTFEALHKEAENRLRDSLKVPAGRKSLPLKDKEDFYLAFCVDLAMHIRDKLKNSLDARSIASSLYQVYMNEQSMAKLRDAKMCRGEVASILNLPDLK